MRPAVVVPLLALVALLAPPTGRAQEASPQAQPAAAPRDVITLDAAVRAALEHQPRLREARATSEAASARTDQARAPLLPQVDLEGQVARRSGTRSATTGTSSAASGLGLTTGTTTYSAGASARQALLDLPQLERWRSAGASAEAQRATARATEQQIVAQVRTAWFAARAARDLVGVAEDTLANQEAHLRQVEAFVEVGTRPAIDLAQARTDRANSQVALIRAGNDYVVTRAQLVQAMGLIARPTSTSATARCRRCPARTARSIRSSPRRSRRGPSSRRSGVRRAPTSSRATPPAPAGCPRCRRGRP